MNGPHLDLDALADLLAGEGTPEQTEHVGACAACSAALVDLDAASVPVAAMLAAVAQAPLPAPPPDLEQRLLDRLAAEAVPAPASPAGRPSGPRLVAAPDPDVAHTTPPSPRVPAARRGTRLPGPALAAGLVGVLALAGLGLAVSRGAGGADSTSTAAGGASLESAVRTVPQQASGTDYGPETASLTRALPALLAGTAEDATEPPASAPAPGDPLGRLRTASGLADCLAALTGSDGPREPLALDYARFQGVPALVVVLPAAERQVDVHVVGPGCRAGAASTLLFRRLDRP